MFIKMIHTFYFRRVPWKPSNWEWDDYFECQQFFIFMEITCFGFEFIGTSGRPNTWMFNDLPGTNSSSILISRWELEVQFVLTIPADASTNI